VQTTDATVRLQALDGTWEVCGADRAIGVDPESVVLTANGWGPDKASFDLKRSPISIWPDLGSYSPVEVEIGGVVVWTGRTGETPIKGGAEQVINVQCEGKQYHLDDDTYERVYAHAKLTDWKDVRSFLSSNLAGYPQSGSVASGTGLTIGWPANTLLINVTAVGVGLDLGPAQSAKRIIITYDWVNLTTNANQKLRILASDIGVGDQGGEVVYETNPGTGTHASQIAAVTLTTAQRFVWIDSISLAGTNFTTEGELSVRLRQILVFSDTAFEAANASILTATTVVLDALKLATILLSDDHSQIQSTSFPIPDLALEKQTSPRAVIEAVNAYHNWITKLDLADRLVFAPRPTAPLLEVGAWAGGDMEDSSANSGEEIYNRAIVEATAADGSRIVAARTAGQIPGAALEALSSPTADNASFATNTASWLSLRGSITRDTTVFRSSPASGRWGAPPTDKLTETFTGTFKGGTSYVLAIWMLSKGGGGGTVLFGTLADCAESHFELPPSEEFVPVLIGWTPKEDTSGVTLRMLQNSIGTSQYWIDDLQLSESAPTLVDRRGFRRTKVIDVSSAITAAEGNQIADTFLEGHLTTPFKGSIKVSPGGVRTVHGGQQVHPSLLIARSQELVRLSQLIDPDTGGIGRDGTIAGVTYTHADETAQVELDDQRGNFDALLQRLQVVQGVGS
jgi:hypothetical protein